MLKFFELEARFPAGVEEFLSPLFWTHINPYGRFHLDMDTRLDLTTSIPATGPA
ncbi:hypothetical protein [Actinopolymorpha alba]|uniref:hypothetical protein n=1 Tax=Actinopolymorpha alba TaxID=533267 RepID=UPI00036562A7|nr:hypothetical protein [Actinopolymorpha alba]